MNTVLAYDLGGSSLRLAIVDKTYQIGSMVRLPLLIPQGSGGEYEADPIVWWESFLEGCRQLVGQGVDLSAVDAIVGCGFTRTQVPISATGKVIHPAITFQDSRGGGVLNEYLLQASDGLLQRVPNLSPYHPIARLLWLKKHKPEVWVNVQTVVEPKDYINYKLTGQLASDHVSQEASRSFFASIEGDQHSRASLGISAEVLPKAISPFDEVGICTADFDNELSGLDGKPVYCGSTDTWTCVLGSGGLNSGAAYNISGTSDVFGVITNSSHTAQGLMTVKWAPKNWQIGGPSQGAATRLNWAANVYMPNTPIQEVIEKAFVTNDPIPLFLPYLEGERTPFWDPNLRGAFLGVGAKHKPVDFIRSVAEGINFLCRLILERAEAATGSKVRHICFSGGLSNSTILRQMKADVLNRPVFTPEAKESGLVGAACLAFGVAKDIPRITQSLLANGAWHQPNTEAAEAFAVRYSIFKDANKAVEDLSHRLTDLCATN